MSPTDREKVIDSLFEELTGSSFAEGCEEHIASGLCGMTDEQLMEYAAKKGTWRPE